MFYSRCVIFIPFMFSAYCQIDPSWKTLFKKTVISNTGYKEYSFANYSNTYTDDVRNTELLNMTTNSALECAFNCIINTDCYTYYYDDTLGICHLIRGE